MCLERRFEKPVQSAGGFMLIESLIRGPVLPLSSAVTESRCGKSTGGIHGHCRHPLPSQLAVAWEKVTEINVPVTLSSVSGRSSLVIANLQQKPA